MKQSTWKPNYTKLRFNEPMRNIAQVSDNGGVITGTPTIDNGGTFSGTDEYISYPNVTYKPGTGDYTMQCRVLFPFTSKTYATIFARGLASNAPAHTFGFLNNSVETDQVIFGQATNGGASWGVLLASGALADGWHVLTASRIGTVTSLYVDGVFVTKNSSGDQDLNTGLDITIGGSGITVDHGGQIKDCLMLDVGVTAAEILDYIENDTYAELDAAKALVDLPLRTSFYKASGTDLLTDGDMEAVGVAAWSAVDATLTKESGARTGGTGSQILRITSTDVSFFGGQAITTIGLRYRVRGWARSDGGATPITTDSGGGLVWVGTSSADWQEFDITGSAGGGTFFIGSSSTSGYVEFDDVSVELMEAQTENIGSLGGTVGVGDKTTTTTFPTQLSPNGNYFDGGDRLVQALLIPALGKDFTLAVLMRPLREAAVSNAVMEIGAYVTDGLLVNQFGTSFFLHWSSSGASVNVVDAFTIGKWSTLIVSSIAGITTSFIDGVLVDTTDLSARAALNTGNYEYKNGAFNVSSAAYWGDLLSPSVRDFGVTPSQARQMHWKMINSLNI